MDTREITIKVNAEAAYGYAAETLDGRPFVVPTSVLPGDLQIVSRAPRRAAERA